MTSVHFCLLMSMLLAMYSGMSKSLAGWLSLAWLVMAIGYLALQAASS